MQSNSGGLGNNHANHTKHISMSGLPYEKKNGLTPNSGKGASNKKNFHIADEEKS